MSGAGGAWPVAVANGWHPLARVDELTRPLARELMGVPVALYHDGERAVALVDRCPHRNFPLSRGRVHEGKLVCGYHGWRFDAEGRCIGVPGAKDALDDGGGDKNRDPRRDANADCGAPSPRDPALPSACARALPVREAAGLVWVSSSETPSDFPDLPAELTSPDLDRFWWPLAASRARLLDAMENLLDPAHPHFLHPGLVRHRGPRRRVRIRFESDARGGTAHYVEDANAAWLPRLFEGARTTSSGHYRAPTTVQLRFASERRASLVLTVFFVPEAEDRTRPVAHFATPRGLLPAWLKRWMLIAFHTPVLNQDRRALALQSETVARFGGPDYAHGPLDLFGPLLWRLANGHAPEAQSRELDLWL